MNGTEELNLDAVWGSAPDDIYALGTVFSPRVREQVVHFNGNTWQTVFEYADGVLLDIWVSEKGTVICAGSRDTESTRLA